MLPRLYSLRKKTGFSQSFRVSLGPVSLAPFFFGFAIILNGLLAGCNKSSSITGEHLTATLIADQDSISPGSSFTLGVRFKLEPGWHIYWKNPGDSGLPPRFSWSSDNAKNKELSIKVKAPLWPYPERIATGPLVNYGYGDVLIPFPATLDSSTKAKSQQISVALQWLVCKDECLPGEGTASITLPITQRAGIPSRYAAEFQRANENLPAPLDRVSIAIEERQDQLIIALIPLEPRYLPQALHFFPEDKRVISNSGEQRVARDGDTLRITLQRDLTNQESISRIRGVLVAQRGWSESGAPRAIEIDTNPNDTTSKEATDLPNSDQVPPESLSLPTITSSDSPSTSNVGVISACILAFIGGIILNLMPCVFPVLSIKVLSFIEQSRHDKLSLRRHALIFSAGVVTSFWVLAVMVLSVRVGSERLGWGFQLQSPAFVAAMIFVFFILGLMFITGIEFGYRFQTKVGGLKLSNDALGSFFNGALATAIATPCTAPFMSTALAATITLPALPSMLIFTALGLGMSAPYIALSYRPELLKALPKPGAWMVTFKQLMAFPLFASVIWLMRVFIRQMGFEPPGLDITTDLLWGILALTFSIWLILRAQSIQAEAIQAKKLAKFYLTTAAIIGGFGVYTAIPNQLEVDESRSRACYSGDGIAPFTDRYGLLWENYTEDRVTKVLAQGRPIFLDFTAEWCITCQVNERVVFGSEEVRDLIAQKNVTLMRADWTSKNPVITTALRRFGRNGVPLNVILTSIRSEPVILPNILTPGLVIAELSKLPNKLPETATAHR